MLCTDTMSVPALTRLCSLPVFPCPLPLHIPGRIASRSPSGCGESLGTGLALFSFCYSLLLWPLWFNRRLNFLLKGCAQRSHTHTPSTNLTSTATVPHGVDIQTEHSARTRSAKIPAHRCCKLWADGKRQWQSVAVAKMKASRVRKCPFRQ